MLTGKNNRRFWLHKLSKDLLKNEFFTSESLVKLVQSYGKKTRKSVFFSYHCVNIRLNFVLLQRIIQLRQSEIGAIESVVFTALSFSSDCSSRRRRLQLTRVWRNALRDTAPSPRAVVGKPSESAVDTDKECLTIRHTSTVSVKFAAEK